MPTAGRRDFADPAAFLLRRAAAYRAFWEHMPLPRSAMPRGPDATIYGRFDFGNLATFLVLDGRQRNRALSSLRHRDFEIAASQGETKDERGLEAKTAWRVPAQSSDVIVAARSVVS